ncbi:MAG TPA: fibronectin type III domain-containing protein [Bdellovibrionales bacterium]|nr:fibronectin type III domain-containing protein [Bdellovibrionales bacterium]
MTARRFSLALLLVFTAFVAACSGFRRADESQPPQGECTQNGNSVNLLWDSSVTADSSLDTSVAGYIIKFGRASRTYTGEVTVTVTPPHQTTTGGSVTGLGMGTYYFAVTAFNSQGESPESNEVSQTFTQCGAIVNLIMGK